MAETRMSNRIYDEIPPAASYINCKSLAAGVAETITAPSTGEFAGKPCACAISATTNIWVNDRGTAAVGTDVSDGTGSALNPPVRRYAPGASISVISDATCLVSAEFWVFGGG